MITLTFEPTNPEQAAMLGQFLPQYMRAGELVVSGEPAAVKAVIDTALTEQQQADLQAAEANREDDAAREAMQAKRDAAKKPKAAKPAATPEASAPSEPTPSPSAAAAEVTLEQVRAKLAALSQAGKAATVKDLIGSFGVAKLTDVPKDKYAELLAQAEAL